MRPKALFTIINLLCITAAAYFAVDGVYGYISARLASQPTSAQQPVYRVNDTNPSQQPLSAYMAILDRNLFNTRTAAESKNDNEKVDVASLEQTKLDLKLWGTVSGSKDGDYAVIEDVKAHEQDLYRTGDTIQTATVKEIFREKVVLTVDGKDEVLQMQDLDTGKSTAGSNRLAAGEGAPFPARTTRAQRISLRRSYIDQSMTDVASLMTQVKIQPHMENGVSAGLSLSSIKPNSIFRRMGLRNGDVITGVDGNEISTVDDALRLVDNLRSSSNLSVQLKRRGRDKTIEYRIR
jgi:general secretion pathway protein C